MPSQGPFSPGSAATEDRGTGGDAWANPSNALTSNDSRASVIAGTSEYLYCSNFGFTLPEGCNVTGIVIECESGTSGSDSDLLLLGAPANSGAIYGGLPHPEFTPTLDSDNSEIYRTVGSTVDSIGAGGNDRSQHNASDFGCVVQATYEGGGGPFTVEVDHVRMTIHYQQGYLAPMGEVPNHVSGVTFPIQVELKMLPNNDRDTTAVGNVTVALASGNGVLSGVLTKPLVAGVVTFNLAISGGIGQHLLNFTKADADPSNSNFFFLEEERRNKVWAGA